MNIEGQPLLLQRNISGVWFLGSQWRRKETGLWSGGYWPCDLGMPLLSTCRVLTCEMEASPARKFWNAFLTAGVFVLQRGPYQRRVLCSLGRKDASAKSQVRA